MGLRGWLKEQGKEVLDFVDPVVKFDVPDAINTVGSFMQDQLLDPETGEPKYFTGGPVTAASSLIEGFSLSNQLFDDKYKRANTLGPRSFDLENTVTKSERDLVIKIQADRNAAAVKEYNKRYNVDQTKNEVLRQEDYILTNAQTKLNRFRDGDIDQEERRRLESEFYQRSGGIQPQANRQMYQDFLNMPKLVDPDDGTFIWGLQAVEDASGNYLFTKAVELRAATGENRYFTGPLVNPDLYNKDREDVDLFTIGSEAVTEQIKKSSERIESPLEILIKQEPERLENWSDTTSQLLNYRSTLKMYELARTRAEENGESLESALQGVYADAGIEEEITEGVMNGFLQLENPDEYLNTINLIFWQYKEAFEPHLEYWTQTDDWFDVNVKPELQTAGVGKQVLAGSFGALMEKPLVAEFVEWIDKFSQTVYILGAGAYETIESLFTDREFDDFWGVNTLDEAGKELMSAFTGGFTEGADISKWDTNDDNRIDIFEMLGTTNTWGAGGVILDIIFAGITDPLLGLGIGARFGRQTLKGVSSALDTTQGALAKYADEIGSNLHLTENKFVDIYNIIKTKGIKALNYDQKLMLEGVIRHQVGLMYQQVPKTRRVRNLIKNNTTVLDKITSDTATILRQLNRGGRDGLRYYGRTIIPTDVVNQGLLNLPAWTKADYLVGEVKRKQYIQHADGSISPLRDAQTSGSTVRDNATEFDRSLAPEPIAERGVLDGLEDVDDFLDDAPATIAKEKDEIFESGVEMNETATVEQIDWYNSQVGVYNYDEMLSGYPTRQLDADGNVVAGTLFDVTDAPVPRNIARPTHYTDEVAKETIETSIGVPLTTTVEDTADALHKILSNENIFPNTEAGRAAKQGYIDQFVQAYDSEIINVVMNFMPSAFKTALWETRVIKYLRQHFSPRSKIARSLGQDAADNFRTLFNMADYKAAMLYKEWTNRVFRVDEFGGKSLAFRAKAQWEALPPQIIDNVSVPRTFEYGNKSMIAQFTTDKETVDAMLKEFPAGTDIGDWLRSFDELRDTIWDLMPTVNAEGKALADVLDKYSYNPRTPAALEAKDISFLEQLKDFGKLTRDDRDALTVWKSGLEKAFGKSFMDQLWVKNMFDDLVSKFARIDSKGDVVSSAAKGGGGGSINAGDQFFNMRTFKPELQDLMILNTEFRNYIRTMFREGMEKNNTAFSWGTKVDKRASAKFGLAKADLTDEQRLIVGKEMADEFTDESVLKDLFRTNYLDAWAYRTKHAFNARMYSDFTHSLVNTTDNLGRPLAIRVDQAEGLIDETGRYMAGEPTGRFATNQLQSGTQYVEVTSVSNSKVRDTPIAGATGHTIYVQQELVDDIRAMFDVLQDPKILGPYLDTVQDIWARYALLSPAFVPRNAQGNVLLAYLGGLKNPVHYINAIRYQTIRRGVYQQMRLTGKSFDEIAEDFNILGTIGQQLGIKNISKSDIIFIRELETNGILSGQVDDIFVTTRGSKKELSKFNPTQLARALNGTIENNARAALYLSGRAQGKTSAMATANVRKYLFDYKDLTLKEQEIRRKYSRFYTFFRKNTSAQIGAFLTMPADIANVARIEKAFEDAVYELLVEPITDPIYENTPVPKWVANAGMRNLNGNLIGMDSPLVSAFQTMQALTAIPMAFIGAIAPTDPSSQWGRIIRTITNTSGGPLVGKDGELPDAIRRASTVFSGFGTAVVTSLFNIGYQQNFFTQKKLDFKGNLFEVANAFNPAVARYFRLVEHIKSDRDTGLVLANWVAGLRVATEEQFLNYMYYDTVPLLDEFKNLIPKDMRVSTKELQQMNLMGDRLSFTQQMTLAAVTMEPEEYEEFYNEIQKEMGLIAQEDGSIYSPLQRPPNDIDRSTPEGERQYEYHRDSFLNKVTDWITAYLNIPEQYKAEDEIVFPNLASLSVMDPTIIFKTILHVLTQSEAAEAGLTQLTKGDQVFLPEEEPTSTGSTLEVVLDVFDIMTEGLPPEMRDVVLRESAPLKDDLTNLFVQFQNAVDAGVDVTEEDFALKFIEEFVGPSDAEVFANTLKVAYPDNHPEILAMLSEAVGPRKEMPPSDEILTKIKATVENRVTLFMAFATANNIPITDELLNLIFVTQLEQNVRGFEDWNKGLSLGLQTLSDKGELFIPKFERFKKDSPEYLAAQEAEQEAVVEGILDLPQFTKESVLETLLNN